MSAKPSYLAPWATSDLNNGPGSTPNKAQPPLSKRTDGWNYGEIVPRDWWNYQLNNTYQWLSYFKDVDETSGNLNKNFSYLSDESSGLDFAILVDFHMLGTGNYGTDDGVETITLTASATNYVCYDTQAFALVKYTSVTSIRAQRDIPLYRVLTGVSSVTSYYDLRSYMPLALVKDNSAVAGVDQSSGTEAYWFFQRDSDTSKSVGWKLQETAGVEYAELTTKIYGTPVEIFQVNLTTNRITFHHDITFSDIVDFDAVANFNNTVDFDAAAQFDATTQFNALATFSAGATVNGTVSFGVTDNSSAALQITSDSKTYLKVDTTNAAEQLVLGDATAKVSVPNNLSVGGGSNLSKIDNVGKFFAGRWSHNGTSFTIEDLPTGWSVARNSVGNYTLTHNLNTASYVMTFGVKQNASSDNNGVSWANKDVNTIDVIIETAENGGANDRDLDFILIVI